MLLSMARCLFVIAEYLVGVAAGVVRQDTEEGGWERVISSKKGALAVQRKFIGKNSGGRWERVARMTQQRLRVRRASSCLDARVFAPLAGLRPAMPLLGSLPHARRAGVRLCCVCSKFACIRAWCTMDVPAEAIAELFESSERVREYNK